MHDSQIVIVIKPDIFSPLITARGKACKWKNKIIWTRWEAYSLLDTLLLFLLFYICDTLILGYIFTWLLWVPLLKPFLANFQNTACNSYSIRFSVSVSVWSFPTSNHHILHIFLLHLEILSFVYIFCQQDCHKHIWNTSQWNYSKLLSIVWSSALYWEVLHFWDFSCIALPYCLEQHSCHCQIMSQMLFDRGAYLQLNQLFCLQIRFVLKDSKCCDTVLQT